MVYTRSQISTQYLRSSIVSTKGLLNGPGQNNCFLNCAVQVSFFHFLFVNFDKTLWKPENPFLSRIGSADYSSYNPICNEYNLKIKIAHTILSNNELIHNKSNLHSANFEDFVHCFSIQCQRAISRNRNFWWELGKLQSSKSKFCFAKANGSKCLSVSHVYGKDVEAISQFFE